MKAYGKSGKIGASGLKANMSRNTASKYIRAGKSPSELNKPHTWRTRSDPFSEHWPEVEQRLRNAPEFEAKTLFEDLLARYPGSYEEGQLRTFQRRVKQWRAEQGPDREVFFNQQHRPGEAFQTDFTWGTALGVTIEGEPFIHIFCHVVLPYSNWQWATICRTESLAALSGGVIPVLNQSLSPMMEVGGGSGLSFPFGSCERGSTTANEREHFEHMAESIYSTTLNDSSWKSRTFMRQNYNMDAIYQRFYIPLFSEIQLRS